MTEHIVQIVASTHLLVNPERGLNVALRIHSLGECYLTVQVATAAGSMTHQVKVPCFPRDVACELEEWLAPSQSIDIMAQLPGRPYGDDHILFQVTEDASRRARQRDGDANRWSHLSDQYQGSTSTQKEPVEGDETVAGSVDGVSACQHEPAIVHSEDAEEEEHTYGLWCEAHQERSETMRLGMLLDPVSHDQVVLSTT